MHRPALVNGEPGLVFYDPTAGRSGCAALEIADGVVVAVRSILNPDKLTQTTDKEQRTDAWGEPAAPTTRAASERARAATGRSPARDRPPGGAWCGGEGRGGRGEARSLRLGLDSGHASRLLRSLEAAGLVEVVPGSTDRRARTARLTEAASPSGPSSTGAVRHWRAPSWSRSPTASATGSSGRCARSSGCSRSRSSRSGRSIPPTRRQAVRALLLRRAEPPLRHAVRPEGRLDRRAARDPAAAALFLVAYLRGARRSAAARSSTSPAVLSDLKRMWVAEPARGLGISRRL